MKAWEGVGVVASARKLIGSTDPLQAEPGTIRGDLSVQTGRLAYVYPILVPLFLIVICFLSRRSDNEHPGRNVVHGSDSPENGKRETGEIF